MFGIIFYLELLSDRVCFIDATARAIRSAGTAMIADVGLAGAFGVVINGHAALGAIIHRIILFNYKLWYIVQWINWNAIGSDFKMQMRAGRKSRASAIADYLPFADVAVFFD